MISDISYFDFTTRTSTVLLSVDRHVEAPNWSRDGEYLIVNGDGALYRVSLRRPELSRIQTGFARSLNNDHGLSPDGCLLAISDKTEFGASCIYTVPVAGGEPVRVTDQVPSYWHGWSPDQQTLVYVGRRDGHFQIFTCPVGGGDEQQLTFEFDHCDGPDFTADGEWIWFNGETRNSVALWRLRPDGSDLQCMLRDERANWFPHPSPHGERVVYLSYAPGTRGHPAGQPVELRCISTTGANRETLVTLIGGQGTINVPGWAPDGTRFAYISYK